MITGISTASLFMRRECEDALARIKDLGAKCAEVFLGTYYEYRPEFAKSHLSAAEGLQVYSVHALSSNFEPQLFSASRRVRGDGFYWLDQLMRSAQIFGAKKYTFHGFISYGGNKPDIEDWAAHMREICAFCARYGVDVCLENVAWCAYNRPGLFRGLKSRCPQLAGVLDIKQARRSGYPVGMYIDDMSGAISHVHLSDVDQDGKICLPGKGIYDFEEIFRRLKDAGFGGAAILEVYGDNYGDERELKNSLDYIDEIIYKVY